MTESEKLLKQLSLIKNRSEAIKAISESIKDTFKSDIGSLLTFVKFRKKDMLIGIDMVTTDKEATINIDHTAAGDIGKLKAAKQALEDGILLEAFIQMSEISDEFAKKMLMADFKEMNSFVNKAEIILRSQSSDLLNKVSKDTGMVTSEGKVAVKNIDKFNEQVFVKSFEEKPEPAPEEKKQEDILPEFEETTSLSIK